jgi:hypothetical protein
VGLVVYPPESWRFRAGSVRRFAVNARELALARSLSIGE